MQRLNRFLSTGQKVMSVENVIRSKLQEAFAPSHLEVINESYKHNVPKGSETHFKVVVVSKTFESKSPLQRHRLVNGALAEELKTGVHALSMQTFAPEQWNSAGESKVTKTPPCMGGSSL